MRKGAPLSRCWGIRKSGRRGRATTLFAGDFLPMVAHLELLSRARYRADLLTLGMFPGENQLWAFLAVCVPPRVESLVAFYARKRAGLAREMELTHKEPPALFQASSLPGQTNLVEQTKGQHRTPHVSQSPSTVGSLVFFLLVSEVPLIAAIGAIGNAGFASVLLFVRKKPLIPGSCSPKSNANFLKPVTRTCKFKCPQGVLASETGYSYLHRRCVELERSALVLLFPSSIQTPNHECAAPLSPRSRLL